MSYTKVSEVKNELKRFKGSFDFDMYFFFYGIFGIGTVKFQT